MISCKQELDKRQFVHDLHNVLLLIRSGIDFIQLDLHENVNTIYRHLKNMEGALECAEKITADFLHNNNVNGKSCWHRGVNINNVVQQICEMLFSLNTNKISVRTNLEEKLWSAQMDEAPLTRAILNLCRNAEEAMPHGGQLFVETKNIACTTGKNCRVPYVSLKVADTGIGIDDHLLPMIFDSHFSTKRTRNGNSRGNGLVFVDEVVSKHGGFVDVVSQKNKGTTFTLYLPALG